MLLAEARFRRPRSAFFSQSFHCGLALGFDEAFELGRFGQFLEVLNDNQKENHKFGTSPTKRNTSLARWCMQLPSKREVDEVGTPFSGGVSREDQKEPPTFLEGST